MAMAMKPPTRVQEKKVKVKNAKTDTILKTPFSLSSARWHEIVIKLVIATNGEATLWVDGQLALDEKGIDLGTMKITRIRFGIPWQKSQSEGVTVYIDDVALSREYLGP